jgi:hypothetical protein
MANQSLKIHFESLSASFQREVAEFIAYLKAKKKKKKPTPKYRKFGYAKGKIQLSKDFDEPLDIFKGFM